MGIMEEVRLVQNGTHACGVREPSRKTLSPPIGNTEMFRGQMEQKIYKRS